MSGLNRDMGTRMSADAHLAQSIADILSTPLGTRLMRRDYGSELPRLIDAPINGETAVDLFIATAEAIERWEPRYRLRRVEIDGATAGRMGLLLSGEVLGIETAVPVTLGASA
jgi:phage baseplate assembly protein W